MLHIVVATICYVNARGACSGTSRVKYHNKEKKKARLSAAGAFGPATIGTGTGDGLINHEFSVVVLLGVAGNTCPVPNKLSYKQRNPNVKT